MISPRGSRAIDTLWINPVPDPADTYQMTMADYADLSGKTQVAPPAQSGTGVIIGIGQSLTAGNDNTQYTPTNTSTVLQINLLNGGVYQAKDPLLGCQVNTATGGSYLTRLADDLVTNSNYTRVLLVPISVGGSEIATWAADGVLNHRIVAACGRVAALGLTVTMILQSQGERDAVNQTSQANYDARCDSAIQTFRDCGVTAPYFVNLETWAGANEVNSSTGKAAVRAAQAAVVDDLTVFQGADFDTITDTGRYDGTHLNATGSASAATKQRARIDAVLFA